MSEIQCRRQRLAYKTPRAHLFMGDGEEALCGFPKKNKAAIREWEEIPDPKPGDVCLACVTRRERLAKDAAPR